MRGLAEAEVANNSMQRTALGAAADTERSPAAHRVNPTCPLSCRAVDNPFRTATPIRRFELPPTKYA